MTGTDQHISLNEAFRRYGVAVTTLRRKIKAGVLVRNSKGGISVVSLRKLYGAPPEHGVKRSDSAPPSDVGSAPPSPDAVAFAKVLAERDALAATLEHERRDRADERAAFRSTITDLSKQLFLVKGADMARDMARITEGQTVTAKAASVAPPTRARTKRPTPKAPPVPPAKPSIFGFFNRFRR